jgi:hypothetical protein
VFRLDAPQLDNGAGLDAAEVPAVYEERITLWRASSFDEAMARAEGEALEYANGIGGEYLRLAQAYQMYDPPADGAEVFSLLRASHLAATEYLDSFFDTGTERQQSAGPHTS